MRNFGSMISVEFADAATADAFWADLRDALGSVV
jgi:hypothetical protein